ncbi:hypothetical protein F2Q69_00046934 [Brassica cretica]|uniref:Uncharacterized protein n=1 Tax=Brassica cretica TaxID=69181 RepID=A0A8S9PTB2_BRACR|nr:hypothetical protein F2Q69_00046934 [Brassica cretica]
MLSRTRKRSPAGAALGSRTSELGSGTPWAEADRGRELEQMREQETRLGFRSSYCVLRSLVSLRYTSGSALGFCSGKGSARGEDLLRDVEALIAPSSPTKLLGVEASSALRRRLRLREGGGFYSSIVSGFDSEGWNSVDEFSSQDERSSPVEDGYVLCEVFALAVAVNMVWSSWVPVCSGESMNDDGSGVNPVKRR